MSNLANSCPTTTINGIRYHAEYSCPSSLPLFKSSSDIHFHYSLDALTRWSPWFADAVKNRTLPRGTADQPIILDKAGHHGLDLIFWAISILEDSLPGVPPAPISMCPQGVVLIQFLDMMPVYSLQRLGREIVGMVSKRELQAHKLEWLILAAASNCEELGPPARAFLPARVDDQIHTVAWAQPYFELYPHVMASLYQIESEWEHLLNRSTVAVARLLQRVQAGAFDLSRVQRITTTKTLIKLLAGDKTSFRAWADKDDVRNLGALLEWQESLGVVPEIKLKLFEIHWPLQKWLCDL
ncbi:uncharacterized protein LOC62_04G006590 [Vanrija pseudolonga]|uniref:BTB domain-containing protein n=1 Tax=Vanrija pseudolonga TaxID=143232 RepID=A0AAF0YFZ2_9TREE|nr:hypothetical protein LOC62_04G006590 [Vanrija pseudolonga]